MDRHLNNQTSPAFVAILAIVVLSFSLMQPTAANAQSTGAGLGLTQNCSDVSSSFNFGGDLNDNSADGTNDAGASAGSGGGSSLLDLLGVLGAGLGCAELFSGHGGSSSGNSGGGSGGSSTGGPSSPSSNAPSVADVPGDTFSPPAPPLGANPQTPAPESGTGLAFGALLVAGAAYTMRRKSAATN